MNYLLKKHLTLLSALLFLTMSFLTVSAEEPADAPFLPEATQGPVWDSPDFGTPWDPIATELPPEPTISIQPEPDSPGDTPEVTASPAPDTPEQSAPPSESIPGPTDITFFPDAPDAMTTPVPVNPSIHGAPGPSRPVPTRKPVNTAVPTPALTDLPETTIDPLPSLPPIPELPEKDEDISIVPSPPSAPPVNHSYPVSDDSLYEGYQLYPFFSRIIATTASYCRVSEQGKRIEVSGNVPQAQAYAVGNAFPVVPGETYYLFFHLTGGEHAYLSVQGAVSLSLSALAVPYAITIPEDANPPYLRFVFVCNGTDENLSNRTTAVFTNFMVTKKPQLFWEPYSSAHIDRSLCEPTERDLLLDDLEALLYTIPPQYSHTYSAESVAAIHASIDRIYDADVKTLPLDKVRALRDDLLSALSGLSFRAGNIPQIYIHTEDGHGTSLTKELGYIPAQVSIVDVTGDQLSAPAQIKIRGNSTAYGEKKPYTIKFSEKQDVLGMGSAKKWALLANCYDPTMLRNYLALEIAQHFGLAYTSQHTFAELWMDDTFMGLYELMEPVETGKNRVPLDTDAGDFLIEYEASKNEEGVTYLTTSSGYRFVLHSPENPDDRTLRQIQLTLEQLDSILSYPFYGPVSTHLDLASFARYFLLNEYMKTVDINYSSVFFYFKDGQLHAGPPWDFDLSTGNANFAIYTSYFHGTPENSYLGRRVVLNPIFNRLTKYPEFQDLLRSVFDEYEAYLASISADGGLLDQLTESYAEEIDRNFSDAGWNVGKIYSNFMATPKPTYAENAAFLKTWLTLRFDWLKEYIANP